MKKVVLFTTLLFWVAAASAVAIYPNKVSVSGKVGDKIPLQVKVYGHKTSVDVEIVKVVDLKSTEDKVLTKFVLGAEQQRSIPMDIVIKETTQYYICAVLSKSKSIRLRTCSLIDIKVIP